MPQENTCSLCTFAGVRNSAIQATCFTLQNQSPAHAQQSSVDHARYTKKMVRRIISPPSSLSTSSSSTSPQQLVLALIYSSHRITLLNHLYVRAHHYHHESYEPYLRNTFIHTILIFTITTSPPNYSYPKPPSGFIFRCI